MGIASSLVHKVNLLEQAEPHQYNPALKLGISIHLPHYSNRVAVVQEKTNTKKQLGIP